MTPQEIRKQILGSVGIARAEFDQPRVLPEDSRQIARNVFYVVRSGQFYGPHDEGELKDFVDEGAFSQSDLCWQEGWKEYLPLASVLSPDRAHTKA